MFCALNTPEDVDDDDGDGERHSFTFIQNGLFDVTSLPNTFLSWLTI